MHALIQELYLQRPTHTPELHDFCVSEVVWIVGATKCPCACSVPHVNSCHDQPGIPLLLAAKYTAFQQAALTSMRDLWLQFAYFLQMRSIGQHYWHVGMWTALGLMLGGAAWSHFSTRIDSESKFIALKCAEQHLRDGNPERVRSCLQTLLAHEPSHERALYLFAGSYILEGNTSQAIDLLKIIPSDCETFYESGLVLADLLIIDGQLGRAETTLRHYVRRFPRSMQARDRLARQYVRLFRYNDARNLFLEHRKLYPDDLSSLPYLLDLEIAVATPHEALPSLENCNRNHPGQPPVVLALARSYALMGQTSLAERYFRAAMTLSPDDPATLIAAADFFLSAGQINEAHEILAKRVTAVHTLSLDSDDYYWFVLSRFRIQTGQYDDALASLEQAMQLKPLHETYLLTMADLQRRRGRTGESAASARLAAQLSRDRQRLMVLADSLNRTHPSAHHCTEIADLFERRGQLDLAASWKQMAGIVSSREHPASLR